jgi:hypothetical protein
MSISKEKIVGTYFMKIRHPPDDRDVVFSASIDNTVTEIDGIQKESDIWLCFSDEGLQFVSRLNRVYGIDSLTHFLGEGHFEIFEVHPV